MQKPHAGKRETLASVCGATQIVPRVRSDVPVTVKDCECMRLALYQPDIPQNTGSILRLAVCLGVEVDLIEPAGFVLSDRQFRRAGLDYAERAVLRRWSSWQAYLAGRSGGRLLLLTTRGDAAYVNFAFRPDDTLLLGRESAGVPDDVHATAAARLRIPMAPACRSLNVALAAAMVLGEALRQTGGWPQG